MDGILSESGGNVGHSILSEGYVAQMVDKWGSLLEGVDGDRRRQSVAMLAENLAQYTRKLPGAQRLTEATTSADAGPWNRFSFPIFMKVWPNLIAHEIFSVQPMSAPYGVIFYFDQKAETTKGRTTAGDVLSDSEDVWYSSEFVEWEVAASDCDGIKYGGGGAALAYTVTYKPVRALNAEYEYSVVVKAVLTADYTDIQQVAIDNGSGGFTGDATAGAIDYVTGAITAFKFTAPPPGTNTIIVDYWYDGELTNQIPEVKITISYSGVKAKSRKLKASWSPEHAQDLSAFHGMTAEDEIVTAMAESVLMDIDRELIKDAYAMGASVNGADQETFDFTVPTGVSERDHIAALLTKISTVSGAIHTATRRYPGNFLVTSPAMVAKIDQLQSTQDFRPLFTSDPLDGARDFEITPADYTDRHSQFGVFKVGVLNRKWVVYQDPYFTSNKILVGLRGRSFVDAGLIYAPYQALAATTTLMNPDNMSFLKGLMTRYGKKKVRPEYYGTVTGTNM